MIDFQPKDPSRLKASEMFLLFAQPLLDTVPNNVSIEEYSFACKFCEMVWNALVIKEWPSNEHHDYLSDLKMQIKTNFNNDYIGLKIVDMMVLRKRELFPDVLWAFSISVRKENGPYQFIVRAEVRMPDPLRVKVPKRWRHLIQNDKINGKTTLHQN